jgi:hypothetical protein
VLGERSSRCYDGTGTLFWLTTGGSTVFDGNGYGGNAGLVREASRVAGGGSADSIRRGRAVRDIL